jgi:hypothetical protein
MNLTYRFPPLARLAQDEERRRTGSEARSRGGLGQMTQPQAAADRGIALSQQSNI